MSTKFVHSIKVPRLYKESAKTVKKVQAEGASFKSLVFKPNHPNVQGIYALVSETLHHNVELKILLEKTNILVENPRLDPWLARVLITELLWGKKDLKSEAKPVQTVVSYKDKLQQALSQNLDATLDPYDKKAVKIPRCVRINTLLTSIDEALEAFCDEGWNLLPGCISYSSYLETLKNMGPDDFVQDFHIPEVLTFFPGTKFYNHPAYLSGKLLLQDKASCLPAFLLNPKPGSEILDMCAAPGMKTTQLAAIINNSGKIYAVEMSEKRYKTLCDFAVEKNATCIEPINADVLTLSYEQYKNVEYILVDPSCSGSGITDRIEIVRQSQQDLLGRVAKLQNLQSMILNFALLNFPNAKRVVYSTCSIYPQENECVIDEALRKVSGFFRLVDLKKELNDEWHNVGSKDYCDYGDRCLYARPEQDMCSGFFVSMFERVVNEISADGVEEDAKEEAKSTEEKTGMEFFEKIENIEEDHGQVSEMIDQPPKLKKSKKKSKNKEESEEVNSSIHIENLEEKIPEKKKKHKKSHDVQDEIRENQTEEEIVNNEENEDKTSHKNKKDKKSKKTDKSAPLDIPMNEENMEKKKQKSKKHKKSIDDHNPVSLEIQDTTNEENKEGTSRKRKHRTIVDVQEITQNDQIVNEIVIESTKKSKKKCKKSKKEAEAEEQ